MKKKVWVVAQRDGEVEGRFSSEQLAWEFLGKAKMAGEWWADSGKVGVEIPPPQLAVDARVGEAVFLVFHRCMLLDDGTFTEVNGGAKPILRTPARVWLDQDVFNAGCHNMRPAIRVKGRSVQAIEKFAHAYRAKWLKRNPAA